MKLARSLASLGAWLLVAPPAAAQDDHHAPASSVEQLGTVHFPTSCRPDVAPKFDRAMRGVPSSAPRAEALPVVANRATGR